MASGKPRRDGRAGPETLPVLFGSGVIATLVAWLRSRHASTMFDAGYVHVRLARRFDDAFQSTRLKWHQDNVDAIKASALNGARRFVPLWAIFCCGCLTGGYTTPTQTTCTGSGRAANCLTTGGQYVPPVYGTTDLNSSGRSSAVRACLYANGWQQVKDKDEARAVTNSLAGAGLTPPSSSEVSTGAVDQARSYCDRIFSSNRDAAMMAVFKNDYGTCVAVRSRE